MGFPTLILIEKDTNVFMNLDLGINEIFLLWVRVPLNDISVSSILKTCCSGWVLRSVQWGHHEYKWALGTFFRLPTLTDLNLQEKKMSIHPHYLHNLWYLQDQNISCIPKLNFTQKIRGEKAVVLFENLPHPKWKIVK